MSQALTDAQSAALYDILTHYDTYAEIRQFRFPGSLKHYGPPFVAHHHKPSTSPALQTLVSRFLLTLPGLKELPEVWWKVQCYDIIENFEHSNLSESYDKGIIGSRKTLATAISALIEYPVRGAFGGFAKVDQVNDHYDLNSAEDLARAFRDFMDGCIYGTVLEETVMKASETDDLGQHSSLIRGVHEFVLVNLASFLHYTLILSPKGQYLLKLIDNANKLIPYTLVKQTLRIGNVASMINAMVKIGLAKMSVTSVTNWIGITASQDDGQNLLQHIISTVLQWDIRDLESRSSKLERERAKFGKEQLQALKAYIEKSREEQERMRKRSQQEQISIVTAILKDTDLEWQLTDLHHKQALEYLNIHLSIRDRREITKTLCHGRPDHFTQSIRELVEAYDPVIRGMHKAIDLSGTIGHFESFVKDMIKLAKIQTDRHGNSTVPTVGDFIMLLRKHQYSSHTFIHQCCKNGPELTSWYLDWAKKAASRFKREDQGSSARGHSAAGDLTRPLNKLFAKLPEETQASILPILDLQVAYLDEMHASSFARLKSVITSPASKNPAIAKIFSGHGSSLSSRPPSRPASPAPDIGFRPDQPSNTLHDTEAPTPTVSSDPGPGAYLARWQDLLDKTPITSLTQGGKLKKASSPEVMQGSTADVDGERLVDFGSKEAKGDKIRVPAKKPDVKLVIDAMGEDFRKLLAKETCYW